MSRKAFTLIELLIVIAMIAGLVGITLPAIRHCRQKVQSLSCTSNLHQLSMVLNAYANEYASYPYGFFDSFWIRSSTSEKFVGDKMKDWAGKWWFELIGQNNQLSPMTIMNCPSSKDDIADGILCGNYGVNSSVCKTSPLSSRTTEFAGKPLTPTQIRGPSEVILVMDAGYSLISWKATLSDPSYGFENPQRNPWFYVPGLTSVNQRKAIAAQNKDDALLGRHPGTTVNIGFCDGHASALDAPSLAVEPLPETQTQSTYRYWSP